MRQSEPTMKTLTVEEAQQQFDQLVSEVAKGVTRVTISKDGEALVRMEPATSAKQAELDALMKDPTFRDLAAISEALKDRPLAEIEEQIAEGLRAGRARRRKEREQTSSTA